MLFRSPGSDLAIFDMDTHSGSGPGSGLAASDPETCPGSGPSQLRLRRLLVSRQQFRQPSMERARGERVPNDSGVESLLRLAQAVTKCSLSVTVSRSRCFGLGQCRGTLSPSTLSPPGPSPQHRPILIKPMVDPKCNVNPIRDHAIRMVPGTCNL